MFQTDSATPWAWGGEGAAQGGVGGLGLGVGVGLINFIVRLFKETTTDKAIHNFHTYLELVKT